MRYETRDKVYIDLINGVYNKIIDSDTILYEVSFNDGSAVLLSGNKSCIPFLGMITPDEDFAFSSVLENVDNPEVVNCFIDTYCEQIKYCFDSRASSLLEQNEWDKLLQYDTLYYNNLERSKVGPLITTKWGQSRSNGIIYDEHAYNYYVNDNSSYCDGYCFAGCIAVSMAQILRYWNRPSENPSKCWENIIIECNKTINNNTNKNYCINNNFENNYNNYVIKSGGSVSLHASNEIILSDGFYATEGANFLAEVIAHDLSGNATVTSRSNQDMNDQHEDDDVIYKDEVELLPSNANPSHISIYPNPANDNITIELTADCHTIEIYDSFGRMMMSQQVTESLSHQVVDVEISEYPSGLYLVVVKDDNNRYYKRIVKN